VIISVDLRLPFVQRAFKDLLLQSISHMLSSHLQYNSQSSCLQV
jgi:hypothetical protein